MNCSEFEAELECLVETRQHHLSEAGSQHANACADCHHRWQNHRLVDAALNAMHPVQPPARLADSVMRALLREPLRPLSSAVVGGGFGKQADGRGKWLAVSVAAASLMMVVGLGLTGRDSSQQLVLAPSPQPPAKPSTVEVRTSVAAVFDDLRAEYRELAAETSATARDFASVLPPGVATVWKANRLADPEPVQNFEPSKSADGASSSGAVSSIGRSFGNQIGQAIDFLWAAVPENVPRG